VGVYCTPLDLARGSFYKGTMKNKILGGGEGFVQTSYSMYVTLYWIVFEWWRLGKRIDEGNFTSTRFHDFETASKSIRLGSVYTKMEHQSGHKCQLQKKKKGFLIYKFKFSTQDYCSNITNVMAIWQNIHAPFLYFLSNVEECVLVAKKCIFFSKFTY